MAWFSLSYNLCWCLPLLGGRADKKDLKNKISFTEQLGKLVPEHSCCGIRSFLCYHQCPQHIGAQQPPHWAQAELRHTHTPGSLPIHPTWHFHHLTEDLQFAVQKMQGQNDSIAGGGLRHYSLFCSCGVPSPQGHLGSLYPFCRGNQNLQRAHWLWEKQKSRNVLLEPVEKPWELLTWKWRVKKPECQHWTKGHRIYWCADFNREMH